MKQEPDETTEWPGGAEGHEARVKDMRRVMQEIEQHRQTGKYPHSLDDEDE